METKTLLHELMSAFSHDLQGTEKRLRQSITDVGSELRGSMQRARSSLDEKDGRVHALLERQGEQIAALHVSLNDLFSELRSSREKPVDHSPDASSGGAHDLHPQADEPKGLIDERGIRLEAAIKVLDAKNRLIQWQLGIIALGVAFPFIRSAFEQIPALCRC